MCLGTVRRAILLTDLAGDDSRAHRLFGVVVVGTDLGMIEESEHLLAMAPQAFEEALGIDIVKGGVDERIEALMKFRFAAGVGLGIRQVVASFPEAYRVLEQTGEGLAEAFPRGGAVVLVDLDEPRSQGCDAFERYRMSSVRKDPWSVSAPTARPSPKARGAPPRPLPAAAPGSRAPPRGSWRGEGFSTVPIERIT